MNFKGYYEVFYKVIGDIWIDYLFKCFIEWFLLVVINFYILCENFVVVYEGLRFWLFIMFKLCLGCGRYWFVFDVWLFVVLILFGMVCLLEYFIGMGINYENKNE